jgi:hypothetical protein
VDFPTFDFDVLDLPRQALVLAAVVWLVVGFGIAWLVAKV